MQLGQQWQFITNTQFDKQDLVMEIYFLFAQWLMLGFWLVPDEAEVKAEQRL